MAVEINSLICHRYLAVQLSSFIRDLFEITFIASVVKDEKKKVKLLASDVYSQNLWVCTFLGGFHIKVTEVIVVPNFRGEGPVHTV